MILARKESSWMLTENNGKDFLFMEGPERALGGLR